MSENVSCQTRREYLRFPCKQEEYTRTVGWLLPTILEEIFNELGFEAYANPIPVNGVDLEICHGEDLVLVAEVLNWSFRSRLTDKRKNNIINNLNEYDCNKLLIHTVPLSNLGDIEENGIHILEIGYQVLPLDYFIHFLMRGEVEGRRIDSYSTRRDVRSKILDYVNNYLFGHKYFKFLIV